MLKQQLQQKLQQKLSPQQIQLIRLLELPAVELEERIKHELEENPALEEGVDIQDPEPQPDDPPTPDAAPDETADDLSLGDYLTEDDIPDYKIRQMTERTEKKENIPYSESQSLGEYLLQQLGLRDLPDEKMKIAEYIIGNIDDDGYLRRDLPAIADDLIFQTAQTTSADEIEAVIHTIQDFDPPGICARNLRECLLLQLEKRTNTTPHTPLAIRILTDCFEEFTRKHYDKIMRTLDAGEHELKQAIQEIIALNPKPGSLWGEAMETTMSQITPDFVVEAHGGELFLTTNNRGIPDLHISRGYMEMFQSYIANKANQTPDMRDAVQFVKQKLDAAQWFIDAVRQRQETMQRTMEAIIMLQKDFFLTGDESSLHPMILKDVSEHAGYDISTISRVSNSKYVQTNFGIYPLKYFFSESIATGSGKEVSTREVKKIMKGYVDAEDKHKPLSDEELAAILNQKGYLIARRTVAKYREQMDIPVARLRKEI
ncbi:MAG: RNA polymerase factor sigma-54 [Tannerellaceae bacterium]|jgi:RNA polymerase sigma-54 factor|nr:RNA polymerase factor sigma-54 [Tannerellaceae bacterium]